MRFTYKTPNAKIIATETFTRSLMLRFQTRIIGMRQHDQSVKIVEAEIKNDKTVTTIALFSQ